MTRSKLFFMGLFLGCLYGCQGQPMKQSQTLSLISTITLPGVSGRIDHLAFDEHTQRIFVAALGNNTVEVVDTKNNKVIYSIRHLNEPQGIAFVPESNILFVANGNNGMCTIFNAENFRKITSIQLSGDADNVRYDSLNKRFFVGYGHGGIAIIDAVTFKQVADIKLEGHPESFQSDMSSKKMYVNVPDKQQIEVIDLAKNQVIDRWKLTIAQANFAMSLDTLHHRLFIGCRHPAKLLVMDANTGKLFAATNTDSDVDDVFYYQKTSSIYLSCGGGYIDVIRQLDTNIYKLTEKIISRSGARTSLLIPQLNRLIVASPKSFRNSAALLVYQIQNQK